MDYSKAAGVDNLSGKLLKDEATVLAKSLFLKSVTYL